MALSDPVALIPPLRATHCTTFLFIISTFVGFGCQPEDSPFKGENESLHKQVAKQESVVVSLQEGNKVMQQQIDLLNQELRDVRKETQRVEAERSALAAKLDAQTTENRKLTTEAQRVAAKTAQLAQTVRVEDKGAQSEDFSQALAAVVKATEEALSRNGYTVRLSVKTDQKAIYVTERKISAPVSLEVAGFRNQYLVSMQVLSSGGTRVSVKADFERMAQGNRLLGTGPDETSDIERRLIAEIGKALTAPGKV
jgi:hypothetical protein